MHPLRRLFGFARAYRRNAVLGTVYSVLNKIFDVLPELRIGVAVDVVVNQKIVLCRAPVLKTRCSGRGCSPRSLFLSGCSNRCSSICRH